MSQQRGTKEAFRPFPVTYENSFLKKLIFYGRLLFDLQMLTIFLDVKKILPTYIGNVLDLGCGQSPYKFLLNESTTNYFGLDTIETLKKFDINNPNIATFNGFDIPFENNKFNALICTEVLEHVQHYQHLINEIYRVMKPDAQGIITVPWSARHHYVPYDFFRYTPNSLKTIFSRFSTVSIKTRGTEISVIANKIMIVYFKNIRPHTLWEWICIPIWIILLPSLIIVFIIAHLSLLFNLGSRDDPLGYTIIVKK